LYAAGMGTPNIASPVEGILTKFTDPNQPEISKRVSKVLKHRDPKSLEFYKRILSYGQTAIFIKPFDNVAILKYKLGFPNYSYTNEFRPIGTLPEEATVFCNNLMDALEEGHAIWTKKPNQYAQLVHNNIKLTCEMFDAKTTAERLEQPIKAAIRIAKDATSLRPVFS
jgi:hypothetical protein